MPTEHNFATTHAVLDAPEQLGLSCIGRFALPTEDEDYKEGQEERIVKALLESANRGASGR